MAIIDILFGHGKDLNLVQIGCRSIVIFFLCLVLIRISGRRSFGLRTPLDNIIVILLGALLSRAVVGASPFLPVVFGSLVFVLLHRLLAWLIVSNKVIAALVEGDKICLYRNGRFIGSNLKKALVSKEDIMQGVRKSALLNDMDLIKEIYMERNGDISPVKLDP